MSGQTSSSGCYDISEGERANEPRQKNPPCHASLWTVGSAGAEMCPEIEFTDISAEYISFQRRGSPINKGQTQSATAPIPDLGNIAATSGRQSAGMEPRGCSASDASARTCDFLLIHSQKCHSTHALNCNPICIDLHLCIHSAVCRTTLDSALSECNANLFQSNHKFSVYSVLS